MEIKLCLLILFVAITVTSAERRTKRQLISCPVNCQCFTVNSGEKRVQCFNAGQIDIPSNIPGDVKYLNLSRNDIQKIRVGKFDNFRMLMSLDLSHNSISVIEKSAFKDLQSLKYLDISYNKISNASLDELRQSSRILQHLDISATSLQHVPELRDPAGVYLKNLTHLSMGSNFFTQIPPNYLPESLKYLDISCLRMRTFPNLALSGLSNLEELNLQGCDGQKIKITAMEGSAIKNSKKLKRLNLRNNLLTIVPHDLPQTLVELDLSENRLQSLKNGVCATQEQLRLSFGDEGSVSQVGSPLSHLIHLKVLKLNNNRITKICIDDFVGMEELKELNMTNCGLYSFHRQAFLYAPSLTMLDLSNNSLTRFVTDELAMMEYMYVSYNRIMEVDNFDRRTFPSLIGSDFSGNPFRCNCDLKPFVEFLRFPEGVRFQNLHAYSKHYSCALPATVKGKPLLTLDFSNDVSCSKEGGINIPTIAAPLSLVGVIILIVIVMAIYKKTQNKDEKSSGGCCTCCFAGNDKKQQKVVVSQAKKYNASSDILIHQNAFLNDAAILCHVKDHKWVINRMVPNIHQHREFIQQSNKRSSSVSMEFNSGRKLNMEVFTIGESIKIDNLNKCIDSNRKIVLVVTQAFISEGSCLFLLKAIREKMKFDPKDAVVVVILDAIPWSSMPQDLQNLMVEKSFLQVPRDGNQKQEFTFWDSMCSYIGSNTSRVSKQPPREIPIENKPALPPKTISNVSESHFAPLRRAGELGHEEIHSQSQANMGETRDQRLRRLGLDQNGGIAENAYSSDVLQRHQLMSIGRHQPLSPNNSVTDHRDLEKLYSLRNEPPKVVYGGTTGGRVRSLLPAHAGDADSLYSEDEEIMQGHEVRPQYRAEIDQHPHNMHRLPSNNPQHGAYNHQPTTHQNSYLGKTSNSEELLHGTNQSFQPSGVGTLPSSVGMSLHHGHLNDAMDMDGEPEPIPVADESTAEEDNNDGTMDSRKKKSKGKFGKLFKKK